MLNRRKPLRSYPDPSNTSGQHLLGFFRGRPPSVDFRRIDPQGRPQDRSRPAAAAGPASFATLSRDSNLLQNARAPQSRAPRGRGSTTPSSVPSQAPLPRRPPELQLKTDLLAALGVAKANRSRTAVGRPAWSMTPWPFTGRRACRRRTSRRLPTTSRPSSTTGSVRRPTPSQGDDHRGWLTTR